ncbi:hypothetical protein ACFL96_08630 [Thermoproteota archaeon]
MATVLEAPRKKALQGVIREIKPDFFASYLICAEIHGEGTEVVSELSRDEVEQLSLEVGDTISIPTY